MSSLEKKAAALREALDEYHLACEYNKELCQRSEQARERCQFLAGKVDNLRNQFYLEAVGKDRIKANKLMFG